MYYFRSDLRAKKPVNVDVPHKRIMLCLNESTLDPFIAVKNDFFNLMKDVKLNRYYSWITKSLLNELADYAQVEKDMLIMGNGADELLYYLFSAINDVQAFAVTLTPSYFDYLSYCNAVGLKLKMLPLDSDFSFSTPKLLDLANDINCKMIILCNPNNPTANLLPPSQIEEILLKNKDRLVLIDETYYEFSQVTWGHKLSQYPNLIIIRTFSKAFSAAGLRFGYMMANADLIYQIKKVVTAFNISIMTQTMAYAILKNKSLFLEHNNIVISERNRVASALKQLPQISVFHSATNFLLFRYNKSVDLFSSLLTNEIAVRDVGNTKILKNCLRVTQGSVQENNMFIKIVKEFLK